VQRLRAAGGHRGREDECAGVRVHGDHQEPGVRRDALAVGRSSAPGRLQRRLGCGHGRQCAPAGHASDGGGSIRIPPASPVRSGSRLRTAACRAALSSIGTTAIRRCTAPLTKTVEDGALVSRPSRRAVRPAIRTAYRNRASRTSPPSGARSRSYASGTRRTWAMPPYSRTSLRRWEEAVKAFGRARPPRRAHQGWAAAARRDWALLGAFEWPRICTGSCPSTSRSSGVGSSPA